MKYYGFERVAACVPNVRVADVDYNVAEVVKLMKECARIGVRIAVFPELCITGYTCGDLFEQPYLLQYAEYGLEEILRATESLPVMAAVGCPLIYEGRRYNCAVMIEAGELLGVVPKIHLPNYGEFYEKRWFESGCGIKGAYIELNGKTVPFGTDLLFSAKSGESAAKVGVEICEDAWVPTPPSCAMAQAGADVILNLSASDELIGKHDYLLNLLSQQSARCRCAYVYASAGWGESTTDLVFAGNAIVCEDGRVKDVEQRFFTEPKIVWSDVDVEKMRTERERYSSFFDNAPAMQQYRMVSPLKPAAVPESYFNELEIAVDPLPFVPGDLGKLKKSCEEIINIQARGLMQRLNVIGCKAIVVGISGGLDSTLALLVAVKAFDNLGLDRKGIVGITMPGEATTSRTHGNAVGLMEELGITSLEIPIGKAVKQHFSDIGQDPGKYDITFENSQARERTQILMDYANKVNGIVLGTGDMSELALGWCTYNGDHMSMYGVNASIPKTLVKHLVKWFATEVGERAADILLDIVDTPISPELVPSGADEIGQKTEDLVGPYELHDFFMYHLLRNSFSPAKIFMLARKAFGESYDAGIILKWLRNFYRRFFNQQFKRSCMPDSPKVGTVCLSPRGDWRVPSDASSRIWMKEIERLEESLK